MRFLDPRFRIVAVLIDDPGYSIEARFVARQQAETIAAQSGFTFADALRHAAVNLRPDMTLPFVAKTLPADDPVAAEDEDLEDDGDSIGTPDVISEPANHVDMHGAEVEPAASHVVICHHRGDHLDDTKADGQIASALKADPGRSDRDIARKCGASPTTVGKVRKALGLGKAVRTVTRGGIAYEMDVRGRS